VELFEKIITPVLSYTEEQPDRRCWSADTDMQWPAGGYGRIVLKEDMGLELGSPEKESLSCLLWTENLTLITDSRITLVGPDFSESIGQSLPFGKVVLVGVTGFDEDNAYERHKELDFLRYDIDLTGFMMRAVSQYMKEWCRVNHEAVANGFSAKVLGSSLIRLLRKKPYVVSAEVIFFTSSTEAVRRLREITAPTEKIVSAMDKMAAEMDFECESCDYQEVCEEADGLRLMRDKLMAGKKEAAPYG
jgi:CO dehydrogenase/acetyl-CoA synthase beta subunit